MGMQLKRIGHVGILVSDFERSFRFYTEVLRCKLTSRNKRPDGSECESHPFSRSCVASQGRTGGYLCDSYYLRGRERAEESVPAC